MPVAESYSLSTSTSSVGIPTCRERDVGRMDAQIRDKARSSPAVGLPRVLWTHFASAPFYAPVADFRGRLSENIM